MSRSVRARLGGGIALSFPPGLVELAAGGTLRTAHWESELARVCPTLSRLHREVVLGMLATPEIADGLGRLPENHQVLLGVAQQGDDLAGVVLLTVGALATPDWWRAAYLARDLSTEFECHLDVEVRELPCRTGAAVLVRHPGDVQYLFPPVVDELTKITVSRADLYLAEGLSGNLAVVSCLSIGSPEPAITELLHGIVATLRAA